MSEQDYSFFGAVEKSFDKAAKHTKWDEGILRSDQSLQRSLPDAFPGKKRQWKY